MTKKRKVCFVITKSEVGGAQKWVKEQIDMLSTNDYECYIFTNRSGWLTMNSNIQKFETCKYIEKRMSIITLFRLYKFAIRNEIDLIIGNSANGGIYTRIISSICKLKSIYVSHGWSSVYNGGKLSYYYNYFERILSHFTSKILCVSNNDFYVARDIIKINPNKLVTIQNKILKIKSEKLIKKDKEVINILFLGRLAYPKEPLALIKAIQNNSLFHLDIVGTGPDESDILTFLKNNCISNVTLKGEIKNFDTFTNYDLFCLISKSEGLPMSALEALSCGLPILISNVGGCPELIQNNGYLTNNEPDDILKGILQIINNFDCYSHNSKKLFSDRFDLSSNFLEYLNFYNNV